MKLPASELIVAENMAAITMPIMPVGRTVLQSVAYTAFMAFASFMSSSGMNTRAAMAGKKKSGGPTKSSVATRYAIFFASFSLLVE